MKKITLTLIMFLSVFFALPVYSASNNSDQTIIFNAINNYRFKHGLSPLKLNSVISQEAAQHSRNMAAKAVPFGHLGYQNRMHRLFSEIQHSRRFAENVAYSYTDATDSIETWINSSPHRRNILGPYNQTGIGIARANGRVYVTQIFIRA